MKLLRSLKHSHKDFYKPKTLYMCLCMYTLTAFTVSTVLAGRSCLCLALSHHLFLTRLLICPIIPCLPFYGGGVHTFGLHPGSLPSTHPFIYVSIHPSSISTIITIFFVFCVLGCSLTEEKPSCTSTIDATELPQSGFHSG